MNFHWNERPRSLKQPKLYSRGPPPECFNDIVETGVVRRLVLHFTKLSQVSARDHAPPEEPHRKTRGFLCISSELLYSPNRRLNQHSLMEAVWCIITMENAFLLEALNILLLSGDGDWKKLRRKLNIMPESLQDWDDWHIDDLILTLARQLDTPTESFITLLGKEFARLIERKYEKELSCLGLNLKGFLANLVCVCDLLKENPAFHTSNDVPELLCNHQDGRIWLCVFTNRKCLRSFVGGVLEGISVLHFGSHVQVTSEEGAIFSWDSKTHNWSPGKNPSKYRFYFKYSLKESHSPRSFLQKEMPEKDYHNKHEKDYKNIHKKDYLDLKLEEEILLGLSDEADDSKITVRNFCQTFPWHIMCNTRMEIIQMGVILMQVFGPNPLLNQEPADSCFRVVSPVGAELEYDDILHYVNTPFVLAIKYQQNGRFKVMDLELKGQMVECPESDSILFIASPVLDGLESLTSRGLFLSDISIHDAKRDVILVGEQSRAQDSMKRRMAQLKVSIEEASQAVDQERQKNVSLLHLIFPPNVARRLWLGETIEVQTHDNVTMLFSDIVGFTAICSTATPFQVISMLQDLYTEFDEYCGILDVYKVETIGDAYCVATNLHRRSDTHAQQAAWMAICMMETCAAHVDHNGQSIRMRIGLHTGTVLAGVVGTAMPRYCMFGSNVTIANQFESTSEPLKIHVSPTTYKLLASSDNWSFTKREVDCLPKNYPTKEGPPYFLESFQHCELSHNATPLEHIERALENLSLDTG